jgi:hypothetical protein
VLLVRSPEAKPARKGVKLAARRDSAMRRRKPGVPVPPAVQ